MALDLDQLARAATRRRSTEVASLNEAARRGLRTAFLCHSHKDAQYVEGLLVLLEEAGWRVYVDWKDHSMPAQPDAETGRKIRARIEATDYFLFLATLNALASRWCPWELGTADGRKPNERILVVPTRSESSFYGNEYVGLYRRFDVASGGGLAVWRPGESTGGVWANQL